MKGLIFDVKRFALHDGPGLRTTVFFKGCPLRCLFCHNPEGQNFKKELLQRPERCIACGICLEVCPAGALHMEKGHIRIERALCEVCGRCAEVCPSEALQVAGREVTVNELLQAVERDRVFYDQSQGGVTCSGGEPTAQPDFLCAFLDQARSKGIHTVLDTCGYAPPEVFEKVCENVDLFLYDLKLLSSDRHKQFTGAENHLIIHNLRLLVSRRKKVLIRFPLIPTINDDRENLEAIAKFVTTLEPTPSVEILPYHRAGIDKYRRLGRPVPDRSIRVPTEEEIQRVARYFSTLGIKVIVRGEIWEDSSHGSHRESEKAS